MNMGRRGVCYSEFVRYNNNSSSHKSSTTLTSSRIRSHKRIKKGIIKNGTGKSCH